MQLDFLVFLQGIHTPLLDMVMNFFSLLGEIAVPLIVLSDTYWCISRKKAFAMLSSLMAALLATQTVKSIVRSPRPFQAHPELIEGGRIETATGYSFPSGHSTTASAFYSSLCAVFRRRWLIAVSAALIVLIPLSRLYLGVHWPADVIAGTAIGLLSGLVLTPVFMRIYEDERKFSLFTITAGAATLMLSLCLAILLEIDAIDKVAFGDLMSNAAVTAGAAIGTYLDRRRLSYDEGKGTLASKARRFIIGMAVLIAVAAIILMIPLPHYASSATLFFAVGIAVTFIYPAIASRLGLYR